MDLIIVKTLILLTIYCFWLPNKWHRKLGELKAWWED